MTAGQAARQLVALFGALSLVGCAHGTDTAKLSKVKSVAIVAFNGEVDITEQRAEWSGGVGSLLSAGQGISDVGSAQTAARRVDEGQKTYDALVDRIARGTGWNVLPRDQVVNNPEVKKLFADKMKNVSVNKGFRFGVDQIVWSEYGSLPKDEQEALKKALGVDALLVVRVQVKQAKIYGYGAGQDGVYDVWPKGILSVSAYDGTGSIWSEPWVEGPQTTGKLKRTMGINDTSNESALVVEATQLAADTLVNKYHQEAGPAAPSQM